VTTGFFVNIILARDGGFDFRQSRRVLDRLPDAAADRVDAVVFPVLSNLNYAFAFNFRIQMVFNRFKAIIRQG
jgi:hypothetical protein